MLTLVLIQFIFTSLLWNVFLGLTSAYISLSSTLSHPLEPVSEVTVGQLVGPYGLGGLLGSGGRHDPRRSTLHPRHCRSLGGAQGHASGSHESRPYRRRCSNPSRSRQCDGLRLGLCYGRSCDRYFDTKTGVNIDETWQQTLKYCLLYYY